MVAIHATPARTWNTFQLEGCRDLYELRALPHVPGRHLLARPKVIYYANNGEDAAMIGFDDSMIYEEMSKRIQRQEDPYSEPQP